MNKKFFRDNPIDQFSAQYLIYAQIDMPEISELASSFTRTITDRAEEQREEIEKEDNPDVLFKLMRARCDVINYEILHKKIIDKEKEMVPRIINSLIKSGNDVFIEHATRIICSCKNNYSQEILGILESIRNPYALSLACIILGYIGDEEVIPIMYDKYLELKKLYLNENFAQGPLIALYKLNERFY